MKVTILVPFRDKHDHKVVYSPGEVKDFDNDRVVALAARGLVKAIEAEPQPEAEAPAKPAKKSKGKGKSPSKKAKEETPEKEVIEAETEADGEADDEADDEVEADND